MELSVGSLFAGIGDIDLAFTQAGCKIAWAIEKDEHAVEHIDTISKKRY